MEWGLMFLVTGTRDKDDWYKSADKMFGMTGLWWLDVLFWPMETLRWFGVWRVRMGNKFVFTLSTWEGKRRDGMKADCEFLDW